jgi:hypothetical protein
MKSAVLIGLAVAVLMPMLTNTEGAQAMIPAHFGIISAPDSYSNENRRRAVVRCGHMVSAIFLNNPEVRGFRISDALMPLVS